MNNQLIEIHREKEKDIPGCITSFLREEGPSNLEEINRKVWIELKVNRNRLLPAVIDAIAELQRQGVICEYPQELLDDPFDYVWALSQKSPTQKAKADEIKI